MAIFINVWFFFLSHLPSWTLLPGTPFLEKHRFLWRRRCQVREGVWGGLVSFYADTTLEYGVRLWGAYCVSEHFWEVRGNGTKQLFVEANISGGYSPQGTLFPGNMTGHLENAQYFTMYDQNNRPQAFGQGKRFHHLPSFTLQLWSLQFSEFLTPILAVS